MDLPVFEDVTDLAVEFNAVVTIDFKHLEPHFLTGDFSGVLLRCQI